MLSQTEFTAAFVQHARTRGFSVQKESEVEFVIGDHSGLQFSISLVNAYSLHRESPADPGAIFQKLLFASSAPQFVGEDRTLGGDGSCR